jgi:hypothetical protein
MLLLGQMFHPTLRQGSKPSGGQAGDPMVQGETLNKNRKGRSLRLLSLGPKCRQRQLHQRLPFPVSWPLNAKAATMKRTETEGERGEEDF